jgi:Stage II sporulation protein E (SpoIIE)
VLRRRDAVRRWAGDEDRILFAFLVVLTLVAATSMYLFSGVIVASALMVPLLLTDMLLSPRRVPAMVAIILAVLAVETYFEYYLPADKSFPARRVVTIILVAVMAALVLLVSARRTRLGVGGLAGESMLIDLQARINRQGRIPLLPRDWYVDLATRSAGGTSFAGDFLVAHRGSVSPSLSMAVVDVSGKGVDAGTRSLLLSGAFGALLGSSPAPRFLTSANDYLVAQDWDEGFATAVHLCVNLSTGEFELRSAGHPPAIQFRAGSGRWQLLDDAGGPVLGLVPGAHFPVIRGSLARHDALLLYTDGLVERPRRDIGQGIDRLIGEAERCVQSGFEGAAERLVAKLGTATDDCALVVLQRR